MSEIDPRADTTQVNWSADLAGEAGSRREATRHTAVRSA